MWVAGAREKASDDREGRDGGLWGHDLVPNGMRGCQGRNEGVPAAAMQSASHTKHALARTARPPDAATWRAAGWRAAYGAEGAWECRVRR